MLGEGCGSGSWGGCMWSSWESGVGGVLGQGAAEGCMGCGGVWGGGLHANVGARTWLFGGEDCAMSPWCCLSPGPRAKWRQLEEGTLMGLSPPATTLVRAHGIGVGEEGRVACGAQRGVWGTAGAVIRGGCLSRGGGCCTILTPPPDLAQLCADEGRLDATTLSENGTMLFFRGGAGGHWGGGVGLGGHGSLEENGVWGK